MVLLLVLAPFVLSSLPPTATRGEEVPSPAEESSRLKFLRPAKIPPSLLCCFPRSLGDCGAECDDGNGGNAEVEEAEAEGIPAAVGGFFKL